MFNKKIMLKSSFNEYKAERLSDGLIELENKMVNILPYFIK